MKKHYVLSIIVFLVALVFASSSFGEEIQGPRNTKGITPDISVGFNGLGDVEVDYALELAEARAVQIEPKRGCCSHHGGVCGCDEKTGRVICCDGTLSPSCR